MQNVKFINNTLAGPDDLELTQAAAPNIPEDILFPDELNRYLRNQVQHLTHENGMLYKNLSDAEMQIKRSATEIKSLSSQLDEYRTACPKGTHAGSAANVATGKIVELSKKLRERNSELEVYKTKCSKLEQAIVDLEKKEKCQNNDNGDKAVPEVQRPNGEAEEQLKIMQDKLSITNSKLYEARNLNTRLKNELKMANRLLHQEVGENFESLQMMANTNPPTWRGRAQIICDLQQKNSELKEKLKTYQQDSGKDRAVSESPLQTRHDKRVENLTKESAELKAALQDAKKKLDAAKARNKVLESEVPALKGKISTIAEQSERDHELIASLTAKVAQAQNIQNETMHQKLVTIQKMEQENKSLQLDLAKQKCKQDNMQAQVEEQKREIENLKDKIRKQHPPSPTGSIDTKMINQLEAERFRLLELTKLANQRLETERAAHTATQVKLRGERQKAAKLEARVARLQLDQRGDGGSTYSIQSMRTKELENRFEDRLQLAEETVKALETRLQVERSEHRADIEEFTKILKNYGYVVKNN